MNIDDLEYEDQIAYWRSEVEEILPLPYIAPHPETQMDPKKLEDSILQLERGILQSELAVYKFHGVIKGRGLGGLYFLDMPEACHDAIEQAKIIFDDDWEKLFVLFEFDRRVRHFKGYEDIILRGDPIKNKDGSFKEIIHTRMNGGFESLGLTQEHANKIMEQFYHDNPAYWDLMAEATRRSISWFATPEIDDVYCKNLLPDENIITRKRPVLSVMQGFFAGEVKSRIIKMCHIN